ncbi:hypothetical protein [Granulicella arctica]|uniref:Outer membrane protein beta-barrel domain-containing protein n=1 Tax=Granulicella arctica TaxID=940613 RepID=A0A7Y9PFV3_9BACT|nr:hypothetical protein [Granulicella arctica]NYF79175.1 hypothetical protein [Granulicella arctica]
MKPSIRAVQVAILILAASHVLFAHAQADPTATQRLRLSAFGGATGTDTGLNSGKNIGITAGLDLGFRSFFSLRPSVEVRGTYPIDKGSVDSQKNFLGGLKVEERFGRFHPYADILFGRGQINYDGGYPNASNTLLVLRSVSNVISPGVGLDLDLTNHLAFKADAQIQRYETPVTTSGVLYSKPITLGVIYRFDFNHRRHSSK